MKSREDGYHSVFTPFHPNAFDESPDQSSEDRSPKTWSTPHRVRSYEAYRKSAPSSPTDPNQARLEFPLAFPPLVHLLRLKNVSSPNVYKYTNTLNVVCCARNASRLPYTTCICTAATNSSLEAEWPPGRASMYFSHKDSPTCQPNLLLRVPSPVEVTQSSRLSNRAMYMTIQTNMPTTPACSSRTSDVRMNDMAGARKCATSISWLCELFTLHGSAWVWFSKRVCRVGCEIRFSKNDVY